MLAGRPSVGRNDACRRRRDRRGGWCRPARPRRKPTGDLVGGPTDSARSGRGRQGSPTDVSRTRALWSDAPCLALTGPFAFQALRDAREICAAKDSDSGRSQQEPPAGKAQPRGGSGKLDQSPAQAVGFPRALSALRITRLFAARMMATLGPAELRAHVYSRGRPGVPSDGAEVRGGGRGSASPVSVGSGAPAQGSRKGSNALTEGREVTGEEGPAGVGMQGTGRSPARGARGGARGGASGGGSGGGRDGRVGAGGRDEEKNQDVVAVLLAALVSLCVEEDAASVEGFGDLQLEGVSLLLVLLGTQAYGPPPLATPSLDSGGTRGEPS